MKTLYLIMPSLLSLFFNRVDLIDLFPLEKRAEIITIYDGDTVLTTFGKLRISKIDAPEKGQKTLRVFRDAGFFATECLKKILSKDVHVILEGKDIYGRWLGDIKINDGLVSEYLIKNGCVCLYPFARFKSLNEKINYVAWLENAKWKKIGLWKWNGFMRPGFFRRAQRFKNLKRYSKTGSN